MRQELIEAEIKIAGRVQGVGFRPFIYRKAIKNNLEGYVINLGDAGVEILVEGYLDDVKHFITEVQSDSPKVSEIDSILVNYYEYKDRFENFIIDKSQHRGKPASGLFPPDIGICEQCMEDIATKNSRWYEYPFTACAWCGPRFAGIYSLPYDRERTHMIEFPMCKYCKDDYSDPLDRRFDAQGITCKYCGPDIDLYDNEGKKIDSRNVFKTVAEKIESGKILAIKGIGGFHLASLATNDDVVQILRKKKDRPQQPFAVMSPCMKKVNCFSFPTKLEEKYLTSWRKPIILVKEKKGILSKYVAPELSTIGVMLPYTGIQTMIFKYIDEPALIMTSGNKPTLPMAINNEDAFKDLEDIADFFLIHNRTIVNRIDDSVLRLIDKKPAFIRRSRGYIPDPIDIPIKKGLCYSMGTELRNAASITTKGKCYTTQYLGDITNIESLEFEENAIKTMKNLLNITCNPDVIACDLHPKYMTSHLADVMSQNTGVMLHKSQHHHAHIVSVAAENNISPEENIIGIALDGAGYGEDGNIWGGEIIISNFSEYERVGHLQNISMPGGDISTYYPFRIIISALTKLNSNKLIRDITKNHIISALKYGKQELELVINQARNEKTIKTSSAGRFLDSIAALLDLVYYRTYEGEPAMKLESLAFNGNPNRVIKKPIIAYKDNNYVLKTADIIDYLIKNKKQFKTQDIAAFIQKYLVDGISLITEEIAKKENLNKVALSGGVFVNKYITKTITRQLKKQNMTVLRQKNVPPGDGGSCLGQACIALNSVI